MRGLSTSEKRLLLVLLIAVIGGGYYFLFHENLERRIQEAEVQLIQDTMNYEYQNRKINELPNLRISLQELESLPNYGDYFFSALEWQEAFMEFLQNLIDDNELLVEQIAFSRNRMNLYEFEELALVLQEYLTGIDIEREEQEERPRIIPFLNSITADMSFFLDMETYENLLYVLDTIQEYEKMVFCGNLTVELVQLSRVPMRLRTEPIIELIDNQDPDNPPLALRCNAQIHFVNFVDVYDQEGWDEVDLEDYSLLSDDIEVEWE